MQSAGTTPERRVGTTCDEGQLGRLAGLIARLYRAWLLLTLGLLAVGLVLDLVEDGTVERATVPLPDLPAALLRGDPAALESTALLFVILGPVIGLVTVFGYCFRSGDRRTAVLAALVLAVVAVLPVARTLGGR